MSSPIPIDRKRCKAIVRRNVGSFRIDDTVVEDCAHTRAPLSVFRFGHPTASSEIGERPFPFSDGCDAENGSSKHLRGVLCSLCLIVALLHNMRHKKDEAKNASERVG